MEFIIEDVIRQARQAGKADRAERLRAGGGPEGDDFELYAAHVRGALREVPLGGASALEPTTYGDGPLKLVLGMVEQHGAFHVEILQTNMQGEKSEAWPS